MDQQPAGYPYAPPPMPPPQALPRRPQRGLSRDVLKYIAIAAMLIDHIAWAFVPTASVLGIAMHFVGRITGPTMFYFIAEDYRHTRNINRYTLRLGVFGLISWVPFYYYEMGHLPGLGGFTPVGVIYTLFLALLAVRARHEIQNPLLKVLAIIGLVLASFIGDWPIYGVLMALAFDLFYERPRAQAIAYSAVVLASILPVLMSWLMFASLGDAAFAATMPGTGMTYTETIANLRANVLINLGQFLPLILLQFYTGKRGRAQSPALATFNKWFFYVFYPLHLIVLGVLRWVVFA